MTTFLRSTDIDFLLGNGPTPVSRKPTASRQGNGKFTGYIQTTYSDGSVISHPIIWNASTREEIEAAYAHNVVEAA